MTDKPSKILIVEDDLALNQGLVLSLKNDSYTTLPVFSIKEAREQLANNIFDLIVQDVNRRATAPQPERKPRSHKN